MDRPHPAPPATGPTGTPPFGTPETRTLDRSGGPERIRYVRPPRREEAPDTGAGDGTRPAALDEDPTKITVEFDHGNRTYRVQSLNLQMWNVHSIARINNSMTVETDLRTGDPVFVTWSQIGVIRLVSPVDDKGFRAPG